MTSFRFWKVMIKANTPAMIIDIVNHRDVVLPWKAWP
jgi:hypothetical protein